MLILSGAATYRVRVLQQGVQAMREEQRQFIQKQNDQLRIQVDKKTLQLRSALLRLEQKKNQLESANQDLSEKSASIQELNEKLEHLISERTEALQSTMRDLDTFLYRTSHDLRRPLMTILGLINVAKKEGNLKKTHEILGHVTKTVDDLDRMLSKLIAISFCYSDKLPKAPVDLFFMAAESIASVTRAYALQSNQIQLTTIGDSGTFSSNVYLLKVMLFSILENAVQYGGETVKIKVIAEVNQNTAVLSVIDNGPGIDSLYQELVFDMFFRGHEKSAGNGLGLYLVKIGVEKLGGSVKLQSSPGNGTEVRLSFS
jgi:signal transduction histidine kinase